MKHRLNPPPAGKGVWKILRDAGIVLIVMLGLGLIALAIGLAFGLRMI